MDYALYEAANDLVAARPWIGHLYGGIERASIPLLACATIGLWLLARPGGPRAWKLASASALGAAALALLGNRAVASFWTRQRPFAEHPGARVFGPHSHDASFPSDHASASFAIAFAVLAYNRVAGWLFVAAAVIIAWGRVLIGVHYPADVAAGLVMGLAAAVIVVRLARPVLYRLVAIVEWATDPVLAWVWRAARRAS